MKPSLTHPSATGKCHAPALSNAYHPSRGIGRSTIWAVSLYLFFYADRLPCQRCFHNRQPICKRQSTPPSLAIPAGSSGTYEKISIGKSLNLIGNGAVIQAGERGRLREYRSERCQHIRLSRQERVLWHKAEQRSGLHCGQQYRHPVHPARDCPPFSDGNIIQETTPASTDWGGEGWYGIYLSNSNDNLILVMWPMAMAPTAPNLFPSCSNNTIRGNVLQGNMYGLYMLQIAAIT